MSNLTDKLDSCIADIIYSGKNKEVDFIVMNNYDYEIFKEELHTKYGPITKEIFLKNSEYKNLLIKSDKCLDRNCILIQWKV